MYSARTNDRLNISHVWPRGVRPRFDAARFPGRGVLALTVFFVFLLIGARPAQAQTESVLYNFIGDPLAPPGASVSGLTPDSAGNLYGTTCEGGRWGEGTVFELLPKSGGGWKEKTLHSFTGGADGNCPAFADVIFDGAGNLYGTAAGGGASGFGVVFELSLVGARWKETVLYSFSGLADGGCPVNGLIMDTKGNLFGTTFGCGAPSSIFELSPSSGGWTEHAIYEIATTYPAGLTMDAAGNIFGVGTSTAFELSPDGSGGWTPTVLHTFGSYKSGILPEGVPVLDKAGNLYGTLSSEGANGCGSVYQLSPRKKKGVWTEKILYSFACGADGFVPAAGLVFDAAGNIYGTTLGGGGCGNFSCGTVFELVAPVGTGGYTHKVLWTFTGTDDGDRPYSSLILDGAGNLYGTTIQGGTHEEGVAFEVTP